ncbi:hypothetical protein F2Q68_00013037 [Brassica cretica]|uniref:Uncharacterized protein n=1 Tax=Brassica cretica TaxID=69181 RepID=A0A8S9H806_BRACR|nr:hypothetical protein F2Q68_00013037 [Brassica cretica]
MKKRILNARHCSKAGSLFSSPRFFVVSEIADPMGISWFSIRLKVVCVSSPIFTHLAGRTSVCLQRFCRRRLRRTSDAIIFPPSN